MRAAEDLSIERGGVRFLTLSEVTDRAGLHRTGVRRYYSCKEELLLELAEVQWTKWRRAIVLGTEGWGVVEPEVVAELLASTIASLPVFCDLLTHVTLSLEGDVAMERARQYKSNAFSEYDVIVGALARGSTLTQEELGQLITATLFLAAGLWQLSHPTATLAQLYREVPEWGHVALNFEPRLSELLVTLARGLKRREVGEFQNNIEQL